jgi:hypothetical protein
VRQDDVEALAVEVRERAGLAEDDYVDVIELVHRLLGAGALRLEPDLAALARLARRRGKYVILVRPRQHDFRFRVVHEVAHWALRELAAVTLSLAQEERAANRLAGAVLSAPSMVQRAFDFYGPDLEHLAQIARAFGVSQTSAQIRLGEVIGDERAILTRRGNRIIESRGAVEWDRIDLGAEAVSAEGKPGLAKAPLFGGLDDGRVAFRASQR